MATQCSSISAKAYFYFCLLSTSLAAMWQHRLLLTCCCELLLRLLTLYVCYGHVNRYTNFPGQLRRGLFVHQLTGLMPCSHVNKKALDQYTNFTEQREELARRQTENGRGEDKIKQLIQTLDMRKDEAIERTFKVTTLHANSP